MTLVVVYPSAPGPIGPGYYCQVQNPAVGPLAIDDTIEWLLETVSGGDIISRLKMVNTAGSHFPAGIMGWRFDSNIDLLNMGVAAPVTPGTACKLQINWKHASGVLVDSVTDTRAWTYDPTNALAELLVALLASSGSGTLATILSAVRTTFPVTH